MAALRFSKDSDLMYTGKNICIVALKKSLAITIFVLSRPYKLASTTIKLDSDQCDFYLYMQDVVYQYYEGGSALEIITKFSILDDNFNLDEFNNNKNKYLNLLLTKTKSSNASMCI